MSTPRARYLVRYVDGGTISSTVSRALAIERAARQYFAVDIIRRSPNGTELVLDLDAEVEAVRNANREWADARRV